MNLSTAKAVRRVKEVGIQKVMGASRRSLVSQYLTESILMGFVALAIALIIVSLFLPVFKQVTSKDLSLTFNSRFIITLVLITLTTGIVSGSYPALYLSGFRPARVLKGNVKNSMSATAFRKGLVVFQFTVSVILIVSVIIVYRQMQLIERSDLGYNRDHVIYFDKGGKNSENKEDYKPGAVYKDLQTFLDKIKAVPGVVNASNFRHSIVNREGGTTDITWQGKSPNDQTSFTDIACGYGFIETLGIKMQEGRPYSTAFGSENDKVVVNEAAVKAMGIPDPIGKTVKIWGNDKQIIGVTNDFHFQSLYKNIGPCFFDLSMNQRVSKIIVRVQPGSEKATIGKIAKLYKEYNGETLDYKFLDADYQALYASEARVAALSKYFAAIAIIISCLGLFGLAAFTAQKRKKEIGIRKVTGASASNITIMLSKDFLMLVFIALLIAFPASWWLMNNWLESFSYRVAFSASVFFTAGASVMAITLFTVIFQSVKAAVANPVKSLRDE